MRKIIAFLIALCCIFFSSCTQISDNTADYIRMNNWKNIFKNGTTVHLEFQENDFAKLSFSSKDKHANTAINGLCIIDKNTMMISDEITKDNYLFNYKVTGDKLKLKTNNGTITLKIVEKTQD
ncbi:MAG: hypothetical protein ACI4HO_04825 [Ruminococcus sp.]